MAEVAWKAGAHHPRIALASLDATAAGGRLADYRAALDIADGTLVADPKPGPPERWRALLARRTWLAGQIDRGTVKYTGDLDADGSPTPVPAPSCRAAPAPPGSCAPTCSRRPY